MRWSLPLLLIAALAFALPVQAQPTPVANAPIPGADLFHSSGVESDTTAPWRYFPLAVGNVWEYGRSPTGLPEIDLGTRRVDIEKDTLIGGTRYFIHRSVFYDENGVPSQSGPTRTPIRFDTLTATVWESFMGGERMFRGIDCPFGAPFDSEVLCGEDEDFPYYTFGGYDEGTLSFPDTSFTVTYKAYANDIGFVISFAAGYGWFAASSDNGNTQVLEYVRIDGVEYGAPQFPVTTEPPPEVEALALDAYPNPFRERLTMTLDLPPAGAARLEVVDVLGRVVRRRDLGVLPAGRHEVQLRTADLAAGPYLVRLVAGEVLRTTQTVTRLR